MRFISLSSLTIAALTIGAFGNASAADIPAAPMYKAPAAVMVFSWTGLYLGANVGGHWGNDAITTTADVPNFGAVSAANIDALSPTNLKPNGFVGGLQAGYNWQVNNFVLGVEADANYLSGQASRALVFLGPAPAAGDTLTNRTRANSLVTLRPRAGVTFDRSLLYITGGLAVGTIKTTDSMSTFGGALLATTNTTKTRMGWTLGGGWEYAFASSWTAKVEYLYVDLGKFDVAIACAAGCVSANDVVVHHKYTDHIARLGINYRFGN